MSTVSNIVKCPHCGVTVAWISTNTFKPFCSERCKMLDFGEWIMAEKFIPGDSQADALDADQ